MDKDLVVMNDGSPTLFKNPNSTVSAVDLAITGSQLRIKWQWVFFRTVAIVIIIPPYQKHNRNTHFKFNLEILGTHRIRHFKKADWDLYQKQLTIKLMDRSLDMEYNYLLKIMDEVDRNNGSTIDSFYLYEVRVYNFKIILL